MEFFITVNHNTYTTTEGFSTLLGVEKSVLLAWHYGNQDLIEKLNHPHDARRRVFHLGDLVAFMRELGLGKVRSKTFKDRTLVPPDHRILGEAATILDPASFAVFRVATGAEPGDFDLPSVDGSWEESPLEIGVDSVQLREGVATVVERNDDLTHEEFNRQYSFVAKSCFGWADETNPECTEHCAVFTACAEARNERLAKIAQQLERRDAANARFNDMQEELARVQRLRDGLSSHVEGLFSR